MNKRMFAFEIVIILAALTLAICAYFYFSRDLQAENKLPEDSDQPIKVVLPGDDEKIFNSINGQEYDNVTVFPDISSEQVKSLLENVKVPDSYAWYFRSTLHSSKNTLSENGIMLFGGDSYKLEIFDENGALKKTVVEESGTVSVIIGDNNSEFVSSASAFEEAGVPSLSDFMNSQLNDFSFSLVESNIGSLLYAEFVSTKGKYSQTEQYYISLDYGIVVRADCFENGNRIYSLETTALYELENIN